MLLLPWLLLIAQASKQAAGHYHGSGRPCQ
jgi:hypothetical protein